LPAPEGGVARQCAEGGRRTVHVSGRDERAVLPVPQEVVGRPDPVREDVRKPTRCCFVDDDRPGLALGEEREDVGDGVELDDPLPFDVSCEDEPDSELVRERLDAGALASLASDDEGPRAGWRRAVKGTVVPPIVERAAGLLVTGSLARDSMIARGAHPERVRIFANTIDVEEFGRRVDELAADRRALRTALGVG
jgi:hypothetical protein